MSENLIFSQRYTLQKMFLQWCSELHGEEDVMPSSCPLNVVGWLDSNGLINRDAVNNFLQNRDRGLV